MIRGKIIGQVWGARQVPGLDRGVNGALYQRRDALADEDVGECRGRRRRAHFASSPFRAM